MGVVLSFFRWTHAETAVELARRAKQRALDSLRESEFMLRSKIAAKRLRIFDVDRDMVMVGLRMQQANNRLQQADSQTFRALYRERHLLLESRQRLIDVESNVKAQKMMLEDSTIFVSSARALTAGASESAESAESIESMMREVDRRNTETMSRQRIVDAIQRVNRQVSEMDEAKLETELSALMNDDEFIGQFDEEDLELARRQVALRLPSVPKTPPEAAADVVRRPTTAAEMGL